MNFTHYESQFREIASQSGYSEENILKCLNYAEKLLNRNLPVIYNTSNLCALVGYKKNYLKRAVQFNKYFYREFKIQKKNGKLRTIKEPLPSLKEIQAWILENILYHIPVSKYAKAYIKGRNLIENVKFHKGKEIVLTLDIKDFFPSINLRMVESVFLSCGYSILISNLLAKLCTLNDELPQGAPTSPCISNIIMNEFDENIGQYCKGNKIKFTRYADDITFSFSKSSIDPSVLITYVRESLLKLGFNLNEDKVHILEPNCRQIITGIVVNEKFQIPKYKRKQIRQEIFFIRKHGLSEHIQFIRNSKANYLNHLEGKINFALHVNPLDKEMAEYKLFIHQLKESRASSK
jgi:RNA-directed DNA polymerase